MIIPWQNKKPKIGENVFIAPNATVIGDVEIADNVCILFGAVIRGDILPIIIGEGSNVQDNSVLHTSRGQNPLIIGKNVTIGHSATLHSAEIENCCLIGMGSTIIDNSKIQQNSIIGANSLVTKGKTFPPKSLIMGSPAKRIRELKSQELEFLPRTAANYQKVGAEYNSYFLSR